MTSVAHAPRSRKIVVGVDIHKHVHVAVAIDTLGVRLGEVLVPVDTGGYHQLARWAGVWRQIEAFGIEGTGSYGAGLTSHLRRRGHRIVEVNRGDRRTRRANGKSDTVGPEPAAPSERPRTPQSLQETRGGPHRSGRDRGNLQGP